MKQSSCQEKLASSTAQASLSHSYFIIPGSKVNFVRALPINPSKRDSLKTQDLDSDLDGDSIASANSDELEQFVTEDIREKEARR